MLNVLAPVPDYTFNQARLDALADLAILDTPPEEGFDSVVELATAVCACPVALISLVDRDRQWFKARVNFPPCETDLSSSVCAYALREPDILVIGDLTADVRTAFNPLVTGDPFIRFYAGAPLRLPDGHVIGSLCVIDKVPRPEGLTPAQASALKALASQVMTQLELGRAVQGQKRLLDQGEVLMRTQAEVSAAKGDLDAILQALMRGVMDVVPHADGGAIEIQDGYDLVYRATAGSIAHEVGFRVPLRDSVAGECLRSDRPMICADVVADGLIKPELIARLNVRSCVLVPLRLADEPLGVLKLQAGRTQAFTQQDLRLARLFAGTITAGLAEFTLRRQARTLQQMLELGDRLRDAASVAEAAAIGSEIAGQVLRLHRAIYGAVDPAAETITIEEHWGADSLSGVHAFRDYGSFVDDLKRGQTVTIDNVATDPRTAGHAGRFQTVGIGALINIPLFERGRFVSAFLAHKDAPHAWTAEEVGLLATIGDRTRATIARLQAEMQQAVLNEELAHRMKNTMAMIQAIANQTLRDVSDKDAVAAFTDRMYALSTAHDVLMQASWADASIAQVVAFAIGSFRQPGRFDVGGPELRLGPRSVLSLSMLLHELATNATKYGALSVDGGRVGLTWRVEPGEMDDALVMDWQERGGPPAREPRRKGFGSRLIGMGLTGSGGTTLTYGPSGFAAEMRAPLAHIQAS